MYKVSLHKKAAKYYESLVNKAARRINKAIEAMIHNPFEEQHIKRLQWTHEGKYRLQG
jgi:mRNA-degrading endonuclease RelE of RelBE toxin-antitoxin system